MSFWGRVADFATARQWKKDEWFAKGDFHKFVKTLRQPKELASCKCQKDMWVKCDKLAGEIYNEVFYGYLKAGGDLRNCDAWGALPDVLKPEFRLIALYILLNFERSEKKVDVPGFVFGGGYISSSGASKNIWAPLLHRRKD